MLEGKKFNVKLIGNTLKNREVPLSVFLKTLDGIQKTMFELGNARLNDIPLGRGRKSDLLLQHCELYLLKAEPGSLDATLAMPLGRQDLAEGIKDFPDIVLEDFQNVIKSITNKKPQILIDTVKSSKIRNRIVNSLNRILPSIDTDYDLCFKFADDKESKKIIKLEETLLPQFIGEEIEESTVKDDYVEISAICKAKCNQNGEIDLKDLKIIDYELLEDTRSFHADVITYESTEFLLKHEIVCQVSKEDNHIIIEYEPFNIIAYGNTRDDAINSFKEAFTMLYNNYCLVDDSKLTNDAIELKNELCGLIEGVQLIENCEDKGNRKKLD